MWHLIKFFSVILFFVSSVSAGELCNLASEALNQAELVRELKIKREVKCVVQDKVAVENYLRETISKKVPEAKIKNEEILFKKIGLIPRDYNYKEEIIKLYTSQLAGYYEPESEYYAMASWMPMQMQMPIAVHELTHALQDQHYNLDNFLDADTLTSDQSLARSAVVEGDATATMYDYFNRQSGQPPLAQQANVSGIIFQAVASSKMVDGFKEAPEALQAFLLFPYTSGLNFSHYFLRQFGYSGLDQIFKRPPTTTKEILDPSYYQQNKPFTPIALSELVNFFELDGFEMEYQDRLGQFGLSTLINSEDPKLASAWENDLAVIQKNTTTVYWLIKLQTSEQAEQLANIFRKINPIGIKQAIVKEASLGLILE